MKKILKTLIILNITMVFGQNDFSVIEADRITNIDSKNTVIIQNPKSSLNINYKPDKIVIELFNRIIANVEELKDGQEIIAKELKKIKRLDDFERMKKNVEVRHKYIDDNIALIKNDSIIINDVIPIFNIHNSIENLEPYAKNYNQEIGFKVVELEQNPFFVFRTDFSCGFFKVCLNNRCSYLNRKGKLMKEFIYGLNSRNFEEGFAYVETIFEGNYIINMQFERIINVTDFDEISDYKYGSAVFSKNMSKGVVTSKGIVIDSKSIFNLDSIKIISILKTKSNLLIEIDAFAGRNLISNNTANKLRVSNCFSNEDKKSIHSKYYYLINKDSINYTIGPFISYKYDDKKNIFYFQNCDNSSNIFSEKHNAYVVNFGKSKNKSVYHLDNYSENIFSSTDTLISKYGKVLYYDKNNNYLNTEQNFLAYSKLGREFPFTQYKYCELTEFSNNTAIVKVCKNVSSWHSNNNYDIDYEGKKDKLKGSFTVDDINYKFNDHLNGKSTNNTYGVIESNGLEIIRPIFKMITRTGDNFNCFFYLKKGKYEGVFKKSIKHWYPVKVILDSNGKCIDGDCNLYNNPSLYIISISN